MTFALFSGGGRGDGDSGGVVVGEWEGERGGVEGPGSEVTCEEWKCCW